MKSANAGPCHSIWLLSDSRGWALQVWCYRMRSESACSTLKRLKTKQTVPTCWSKHVTNDILLLSQVVYICHKHRKWPAFRLKIHIEKLMVSKNSASQSTSCSKLANRIMKTCFFHPTCSLQVGGSRSEDLQIETNSKEELRKDDRRSTGITWWQLKRFLCSPRSLGEKDPIWRAYFSDGLKPPKPS